MTNSQAKWPAPRGDLRCLDGRTICLLLQTSALLPDAVHEYENWLREWTLIEDSLGKCLLDMMPASGKHRLC